VRIREHKNITSQQIGTGKFLGNVKITHKNITNLIPRFSAQAIVETQKIAQNLRTF
jgi:hypothetical protein